MQNIQIQMSAPADGDMNVIMATNFPPNDIIANPPPPEHKAEHIIRPGKTVIVFSGSDEEKISASAAISYRVAGLKRTSMCSVFGKPPFIDRFVKNVPSGSFIFGVPGNQQTEDNRQELYYKFAENDPFIFIFENLLASDYGFVARRALHSSFALIMTMVSPSKEDVFSKLASLIVMTENEKKTFKLTETDRARLMTVIHEGENVSEDFYRWFGENLAVKSDNYGLKSADASGFVKGAAGNA